ncbi:MAG: HAMP domain-containing histidine kinase [Blastocatellia bacterium]|nr:HAMP domain-containing histidine kinase [Blastocatellia bacterium]
MEGHGGTITVESSGLQKGATFIINLPLAKGA